MAIFVSTQKLKTAGRGRHDVQRVACSTVYETEQLANTLSKELKGKVSFIQPRKDSDSDYETGARWTPGIMVWSSALEEFDDQGEFVYISGQLMELVCLDLKREYLRDHHDETFKELDYWERKEKEIAYRIYRDQADVPDLSEYGEYLSKSAILSLKNLTKRLEKIDLGHRRRVNVRAVRNRETEEERLEHFSGSGDKDNPNLDKWREKWIANS